MKIKFTKLIKIVLSLFLLWWIFILAWCKNEVEQISIQDNEQPLNDFRQQKELALQDIENYKKEYEEYESKMNELHMLAEKKREEIQELDRLIYWDEETIPVMDKICELSPNSPMCNNWEMLIDLKDVAEKRGTDYKLLLGIMYAESHIWFAFRPAHCWVTNNRAWLKARKYDDGTVSEWFDKQENKVEWCWLYNFDTVHEFFESLANTISIWYAKCNNDIYCINKSFVWHESASWTNNVWKFYSLKK